MIKRAEGTASLLNGTSAFIVGAVIGTLGGLIGLGGAEFRLPLLIALFGFVALEAVVLNKAISLVVVASALVFRRLVAGRDSQRRSVAAPRGDSAHLRHQDLAPSLRSSCALDNDSGTELLSLQMTVASITAALEPTIQSLATELPIALSALRRGIRRAGAGTSLFGPLTGAQAELARLVRHRPGVSVAVAATELQLSANTVSTLVGQLIEAGLLVREADPADRRVARLRLTERARTEIRRWQDQQAQQVAAALRRLPSGKVRALAAAMPALSALVEELAGGAEEVS